MTIKETLDKTTSEYPKVLKLVRTYKKTFDSEQEVLDAITEICRDRGIWHPDDKKAEATFGIADDEGGLPRDEEKEKAEFLSCYPEVSWPPKTLEDFAMMNAMDLPREDVYPDDIFDDDSEYEFKYE